jgi:Tol biopolymer transport system component
MNRLILPSYGLLILLVLDPVTADRRGAQESGKKKVPPADRLLFYRAGYLTLISPDGKDEKQIPKDAYHSTLAWLSPDGKRFAYLVDVKDGSDEKGRDPRRKVYVRGLDEPEPGTDLGVAAQNDLCWSPDGSHLIAVEYVHGKGPAVEKFVNWLVDVKTKKKEALKLPDNHAVKDWSCDGKFFLTTAHELKKTPRTARLYLMNRDGMEVKALTDGSEPVYSGRLSPDGRKLLYLAPDPDRKGKDPNRALFVLDIQKGQSMRVERQPPKCVFDGFCWSPDGKRIAYVWGQVPEKKDQDVEWSLVVADADGKNPVTIATEKTLSTSPIVMTGVDWR